MEQQHLSKPRARRRHFAGEREEARRLGMPEAALAAFRTHRNNAKRRRVPFHLSVSEWWWFWSQDDRWERRGRGSNDLVMARRGDAGPYAVDNIVCLTLAAN